MKNFLDITAIDVSNKLLVTVDLKEHDNPKFEFTVNGLSLKTQMYFDLLDSLHFSCDISNGAVEVVKITINNKEILPVYQHLASPATAWITENWKFEMPGPFYPWYHEITGQGWIA